MGNTEAANRANLEAIQAKIDNKIDVIRSVIQKDDELKSFLEELADKNGKVSVNWFCSLNCQKRNLQSFSKSSKTYRMNANRIQDQVESLKNATRLLSKSTASDKIDYESLYREMLFRNAALTEDLLNQQELIIQREEEFSRKNALICDLRERIAKCECEKRELMAKMTNYSVTTIAQIKL
ncbi:hypothetical protein [Shewanella sp. MF08487]|uniref:hypothetical protein n=1 Tax=Shewanella sp. MF08487 TaxID=3434873 RepID=UPI003D7BC49F